MIDTDFTYHVFSLRMGGWWGKNAVYTSDVKDAKPYTREEAIKHCKSRYTTGGLADVPVRIEDIQAVAR